MKRFRFRPQIILDIQKRKVEQLQSELARSLLKKRQMEEELQAVRNTYNEVATAKERCSTSGITVGELRLYGERLKSLKDRILVQENSLVQQEKVVLARQAELNEALKYQKTLEKIKEIRYAEYKEEIKQRDSKLMDEMAIRSFQLG